MTPDRRHPALQGVLLLALLAAPACAQTPANRGEERATAAAAGAPGIDSVQARASRARVRGSEQAPVTIVEVSDFQCPYCRQFTEEAYKQIDSAYIRPGKAKLVFIAYPIPQHTEAWAATEAAYCAGAQGQFWPMHDRLFAAQREWSGQPGAAGRFAGYAQALRLDMDAYRRCVDEDQVASMIVNDVMQASSAGISGTPTFVLNGQRVVGGAAPFEEFRTNIEAILAGGGAQQPGAPQGQPQPPAPTAPPQS
ncbi:MAG TPA: thioredoxin domain-containing protein [Longimicrobiaceae bacterium]|nr:thioredoxin domain-containing protein [Longimicrobiaceae bacterium]